MHLTVFIPGGELEGYGPSPPLIEYSGGFIPGVVLKNIFDGSRPIRYLNKGEELTIKDI